MHLLKRKKKNSLKARITLTLTKWPGKNCLTASKPTATKTTWHSKLSELKKEQPPLSTVFLFFLSFSSQYLFFVNAYMHSMWVKLILIKCSYSLFISMHLRRRLHAVWHGLPFSHFCLKLVWVTWREEQMEGYSFFMITKSLEKS